MTSWLRLISCLFCCLIRLCLLRKLLSKIVPDSRYVLLILVWIPTFTKEYAWKLCPYYSNVIRWTQDKVGALWCIWSINIFVNNWKTAAYAIHCRMIYVSNVVLTAAYTLFFIHLLHFANLFGGPMWEIACRDCPKQTLDTFVLETTKHRSIFCVLVCAPELSNYFDTVLRNSIKTVFYHLLSYQRKSSLLLHKELSSNWQFIAPPVSAFNQTGNLSRQSVGAFTLTANLLRRTGRRTKKTFILFNSSIFQFNMHVKKEIVSKRGLTLPRLKPVGFLLPKSTCISAVTDVQDQAMPSALIG